MKLERINNIQFGARIKINKPKISKTFLKSGGSSSVASGISTISTGVASGADMTVHGIPSVVPAMQHVSSLFDRFADMGHKIFEIFTKNGYEHNGYDASFFSSSMLTGGAYTYAQGMNNIIKGIEKNYKSKIPT